MKITRKSQKRTVQIEKIDKTGNTTSKKHSVA